MPTKLTSKSIFLIIAGILILRLATLFMPVPTYADYYINQGILNAENNNFSQALESYKKALDHNQNHPEANYQLGVIYSKKGDEGSALKHYQKVVDSNFIESRYALAYHVLGTHYFDQKDFPTSIAFFNKAISIRGIRKDYYYLGLIHLINNDVQKAKEQLSKMHDGLVASTEERLRVQPFYNRLYELIMKKSENPNYVIKESEFQPTINDYERNRRL